jgi:hypothetical protein
MVLCLSVLVPNEHHYNDYHHNFNHYYYNHNYYNHNHALYFEFNDHRD